MAYPVTVAAIVIGRNEGERLIRCLASLAGVSPVIYVDSGSTDGSLEAAQDAGAEVVELDLSLPFTAARARNAGLERLRDVGDSSDLVQFLDGDCELRAGWLDAARAAIEGADDIAVVCGRRRERFPQASVYNRLIDAEWETPVGETQACGGDALMRRAALEDVGGYRDDLIAGEEPEMCFRMRRKGWRILRIDAEMTWHDAAMVRVSQWWQRSRRAGFAFANAAALHGRSSERFRIRETRRAIVWGAALPAIAVIGTVISPWALALLLLYPAQVLRLSARGLGLIDAVFLTLGKLPEAQGVLGFWWGQATGRRRGLIEYK